MPKTIVLVDDDRNILASVSLGLEAEGFNVRAFSNGEEALRSLAQSPGDLWVLDIKMPRMDGMEVLRRLREKTSVPAIFLTSKDAEEDEVSGLKAGADDYIRKPFSQKLLIERIRALLRRIDPAQTNPSKDSLIIRGDLVMDGVRHLCTWKGKEVPLTVTEFLLLKSLALRLGHIKSRNQLIDTAYGENIYIDDRTIDSHVKRMRKKFKDIDQEFSQIETLYGAGYRYRE